MRQKLCLKSPVLPPSQQQQNLKSPRRQRLTQHHQQPSLKMRVLLVPWTCNHSWMMLVRTLVALMPECESSVGSLVDVPYAFVSQSLIAWCIHQHIMSLVPEWYSLRRLVANHISVSGVMLLYVLIFLYFVVDRSVATGLQHSICTNNFVVHVACHWVSNRTHKTSHITILMILCLSVRCQLLLQFCLLCLYSIWHGVACRNVLGHLRFNLINAPSRLLA